MTEPLTTKWSLLSFFWVHSGYFPTESIEHLKCVFFSSSEQAMNASALFVSFISSVGTFTLEMRTSCWWFLSNRWASWKTVFLCTCILPACWRFVSVYYNHHKAPATQGVETPSLKPILRRQWSYWCFSKINCGNTFQRSVKWENNQSLKSIFNSARAAVNKAISVTANAKETHLFCLCLSSWVTPCLLAFYVMK